MFGMGFTEILLIAIVAILFLGPDKLPGAMVEIAKFIKSAKNAITDVKTSLAEEVNIDELKREALSYKEQLDSASRELQGFKNINPMDTLNDEFSSVKENFAAMTQAKPEEKTSEVSATQVEPKQQKEISFKKKTVKETTINDIKKENESSDS